MCLLVSLRKTYAFLAIIYYCAAANVELFDYDQQYSNTRCKSGVLSGVDQSAFRSVVHLDNDVGENDYVNYEIKEESESLFKQLLTIDLTYECTSKILTPNLEYRCQKLSEREFRISVLLKASKQVSNATVRAFLARVDVNSKIIQLPVVHTNDAAGQLTINGITRQNNQECSANVDSKELSLKFKCNSSAKPCVIEIQVNNSTSRGNDRVEFKRDNKITEEVVATIKYSACRLDGENVSISCRINISLAGVADNKHKDLSYLYLFISFPVISAGLLLLWNRKSLLQWIEKKNEDDPGKFKPMKKDEEVPGADTKFLEANQNDNNKTYTETERGEKILLVSNHVVDAPLTTLDDKAD